MGRLAVLGDQVTKPEAIVRRLRMRCEVQCHPLWDLDSPNNVDPADLPISGELASALGEWASRFDALYDLENPQWDPYASPFASPDQERKWEESFDRDGRQLCRRLRHELGTGYHIEYRTRREPADTRRPS